MSSLLQYKCPKCGGNIEFDSSIQKPKCPFCDSEFELDDLKAFDSELSEDKSEWQTKEEKWAENEAGNGMKIFVCESCGGEVVTEETTAATRCPWCDNPIVVKGSVAGSLKPDFVIPFKLDKAAAKEGFKKHLSGKKFLPPVFIDENHMDEIKGIYVPFWLFDADAKAQFRFRGTKTRSWRSGDYRYTETLHFALVRDGEMCFDNIPVDGSKKMADDLMESVEPFDYSEMVSFETAYLSGFLADKYDVSAEDSMPRADKRIKQSATDEMMKTTRGYSGVTVQSSFVDVRKGTVSYALLPIWVMNTTWNGQRYIFAMNGQTGKFVGNLPCDSHLKNVYFWKWFGILTGICTAAIILLRLLLG